MRNQSTYENPDASMKDKLIAQLKKQLYDLKECDHTYIRLIDQVKVSQSKYSLLQEDSQRIDNQYKIKGDIARTNISQLRNQLDNTKIQIHKYHVNIDQILREIGNFNRISQNKQNEISGQMTINQQIEKNNQDQIQINKAMNQKIQNMKEDRNKSEGDCERLRKILQDNMNNLKNLQKEARQIQSSNERNKIILQIAVADRDQLMEGLRSREELVQNTNKKLEELQRQRDDLQEKTNKLQKQCLKSEGDLKSINSQLQSGINRNKQLSNRLKNQQKNLRNLETDVEQRYLARQTLIKENKSLSSQHSVLSSEIDRILMSILEMEKFNEDLQKQIRHFIESDEQARKLLNRKDAMTKMLDAVLNNLHKSAEDIAHLRDN